MLRFSLIGWLLFLYFVQAQAQDTCYVKYTPSDDRLINEVTAATATVFYSPASRTASLNRLLENLFDEGYLLATWQARDSLGDTLVVEINKGEKIYWAKLNTLEADPFLLHEAGYEKKQFDGTVFRYASLNVLFHALINAAENNGYPFAAIHLENIVWGDSGISATLILKKNQRIYFDSIRIVGSLQLSKNYLAQYTGIKAGELYDEHLLDDLNDRLKEIPFVSVVRPAQIEFEGNTARPVVFLEEKQSSRFDFIVGVIPNENISGRFIFTGEGRLDLQNIFHQGEIFNFHFSKLESTSKELQTHLMYPYLPGLPLGAEAGFDLFLKDSTYLERIGTAGLLYQMMGSNHIRAFVTVYHSDVLNVDTSYIITFKTLPAILDLKERTYGLEWNYEHLNYRFNPRSGYAWKVSAAAGNKTILENSTITSLHDPLEPDYDFASLYDSIGHSAPSFNYQYDLQYFIPLAKRSAVLLRARGASLISQLLPENELYRIGGNALLRGFDERSLPVSQYHLITVEWRYILSQNSFAALFADGGYTENKSNERVITDTPLGVGAGINFETKAGIFGLSYALGMSQQIPISFKNTKIHFGYINYF